MDVFSSTDRTSEPTVDLYFFSTLSSLVINVSTSVLVIPIEAAAVRYGQLYLSQWAPKLVIFSPLIVESVEELLITLENIKSKIS